MIDQINQTHHPLVDLESMTEWKNDYTDDESYKYSRSWSIVKILQTISEMKGCTS